MKTGRAQPEATPWQARSRSSSCPRRHAAAKKVGRRAPATPFSLIAALALLTLIAAAGCTSATKELSLEEGRRQADWNALVSAAPAPPVTLSWPAALAQMRAHNSKVRAADLDISRAAEAFEQVKRSLIPTASFSAGYQRLLDSGNNVQFEPFTFAANLFFDVPGFFSYRVRYEAAILTLAHARLVRETVWRDQVIALYRAEIEGRELQDRVSRLSRSETATVSLAASAPDTAAKERGALADEHRELAKDRADWLDRTGEILGLRGVPIVLSDDGLPPLPYALASDRPEPRTLAQLPLRLAALDLLALRARELGITLQEWPEIQMSVNSPTVFEAGQGQSYVWSPRQVFIGVDSFWTLDTQGRHASDRRLLDGEMSYRHEVLEQEAAATAAKLRGALDGLAQTDRELDSVEQALASSDESLRADLLNAQQTLISDRQAWRLTLWFFDDSKWPNDSGVGKG